MRLTYRLMNFVRYVFQMSKTCGHLNRDTPCSYAYRDREREVDGGVYRDRERGEVDGGVSTALYIILESRYSEYVVSFSFI